MQPHQPHTLRAWLPDQLIASGRHLVDVTAEVVGALAGSLSTEFPLPDRPHAEARFRGSMSPQLRKVAQEITGVRLS